VPIDPARDLGQSAQFIHEKEWENCHICLPTDPIFLSMLAGQG